jgi:hypothetical protein
VASIFRKLAGQHSQRLLDGRQEVLDSLFEGETRRIRFFEQETLKKHVGHVYFNFEGMPTDVGLDPTLFRITLTGERVMATALTALCSFPRVTSIELRSIHLNKKDAQTLSNFLPPISNLVLHDCTWDVAIEKDDSLNIQAENLTIMSVARGRHRNLIPSLLTGTGIKKLTISHYS